MTKKQKKDVYFIWDMDEDKRLGRWFEDIDDANDVLEGLVGEDIYKYLARNDCRYEIRHYDLTDPEQKEWYDEENEENPNLIQTNIK